MEDKNLIKRTCCDGYDITLKIDMGDFVVSVDESEVRFDTRTHTLQQAIEVYQKSVNDNAENIKYNGHFSTGLGYVSQMVKSDDATRMSKALKNIGLKKRHRSSDFHFTLQYDKRNPEIDVAEMERHIFLNAEPIGVEILAPDGPVPALAIIFKSTDLEKRFAELTKLGFVYDHSAFIAHVTVKYNPEEGDLELLENNIDEIIKRFGVIQCGNERWKKARIN